MSKNAFSVKPSGKFDGVYSITTDGSESLGTLNQVPGIDVYGERLFRVSPTEEYREWNPNRSKLCAYLRKGGKEFYLKEGISVRELEREVKKKVAERPSPYGDIEESLRGLLQTKVHVTARKNRGKVIIEYYSRDDLDRILDLIFQGGEQLN